MITLATLPQATDIEVFLQGKNHLLKQNAKAFSFEGNSCVYRHHDGTKCAGGCFINDEEYDKDMEGSDWAELVYGGFVPEEHAKLISALQRIHDSYEIQDWPANLDKLEERVRKGEFSV